MFIKRIILLLSIFLIISFGIPSCTVFAAEATGGTITYTDSDGAASLLVNIAPNLQTGGNVWVYLLSLVVVVLLVLVIMRKMFVLKRRV